METTPTRGTGALGSEKRRENKLPKQGRGRRGGETVTGDSCLQLPKKDRTMEAGSGS